ncbi:MAG: DUF1287 domain-containing protein [Flavobacteriales bacterium]|nr:DUF1287 domain-containing protein [Flavobacteriales bacterium]
MIAFILFQTLFIGTPQELSTAAECLHDPHVVYDPSYQNIEYPCGDVPQEQGVCTDVIVRAFKIMGRCLQEEIHDFRISQGKSTDKNIDHRRVPNLAAYFSSLHMEVQGDLEPGDLIWWKLGGEDGINHIGIVTDNGMVMHNIGRGQVADVRPNDYHIHRIYRLPG